MISKAEARGSRSSRNNKKRSKWERVSNKAHKRGISEIVSREFNQLRREE